MATDYVEDYEEVTGKKIPKRDVEKKVVNPPNDTPLYDETQAETK